MTMEYGELVVGLIGSFMALMLVWPSFRSHNAGGRSMATMALIWIVLIAALAAIFSGFGR